LNIFSSSFTVLPVAIGAIWSEKSGSLGRPKRYSSFNVAASFKPSSVKLNPCSVIQLRFFKRLITSEKLGQYVLNISLSVGWIPSNSCKISHLS
jgi:hypothetical protein